MTIPKLLPDQTFYPPPGRRGLGALTLILVAISCLVAAPAAQAPSKGKSAATITGAFADSCRDFAAHSSKDISYVELRYRTGLVVRNEHINSPDHAVDGVAGEEIESATVKSGTTIEEFACVPSNRAPTALLQVQTPPTDDQVLGCYRFLIGGDADGLVCEQSSPRTVWMSASEIPPNSANLKLLLWGCVISTSCPFAEGFPFTVSFRGTASSDPDGDITSWSLDFGDGTSASGSWTTAPPTEVSHAYSLGPSGYWCGGICVITLTVTDSAGQSASDRMLMTYIDQRPG